MNNLPLLPPPEPDPDIHEQPHVQRAIKMLWFRSRQFEHWLSPDGAMRAWLRWCLRMSLLLVIPGVFIVPVVICVLRGLAMVFAMLVRLCLDVLLVMAAVIVMLLLFGVLRGMLSSKQR